jgi:P-type Ca2+ transporter type 2C
MELGHGSEKQVRVVTRARDADSASVVVLSSGLRGRARLRVPGLYRHPALAIHLQEYLDGEDDVDAVTASPLTGNVLVLYDAARLHVSDVRRRVARAAAVHRPPRKVAVAEDQPTTQPMATPRTAWHALEVAEVVRSVDATPASGLSTAEAERRLATFGLNRVPAPRPKAALQVIWEQVATLPMLLLGGAAVVSIATGGLVDGAAILAVVAINAGIGYATESRVEQILASLKEVGVPMAFLRRGGKERLVARTQLVPGDVVLLRAGHDIPADGRLIEVNALQTDESALTGEALPVTKSAHPLAVLDVPIADRTNMVYAGSVVAEGTAEAVVTATGRRTELGRIRALVGATSAPPTPLERQLDHTGSQLALVSLGVCGALFLIGVLRGLPVLGMFRTATSLAVAAVPEGLPTVATTTLALGMRKMFERRTLVRRLAAVESLGSTTVICVDKTGTVTENRMTVARWHIADRDRFQETLAVEDLDPAVTRALEVAVLCNEAALTVDARGSAQIDGSATEAALLVAARSGGVDVAALRARYPLLSILPRADGRNWMGSTHAIRGERFFAVKGAPEEVLRNSTRWLTVDGEVVLDGGARRRILSVNDQMAGEGLRVLGLAFKTADADDEASWNELTWVGLVGLIDPIRAGVREAFAVCQAAGIRPVMITGDQSLTAVAVGRELGLLRDGQIRVLQAGALAHLDTGALRGVVREVDVFARVAPAQKYDIVRARCRRAARWWP